MIYRVTTAGAYSTIHSFSTDSGVNAFGALVVGDDGTLYGTTSAGGTAPGSQEAAGTIFSITADGSFNVLHTFLSTGSVETVYGPEYYFADGSSPLVPLTLGSDGNLYGVTSYGGSGYNYGYNQGQVNPAYSGTVFLQDISAVDIH